VVLAVFDTAGVLRRGGRGPRTARQRHRAGADRLLDRRPRRAAGPGRAAGWLRGVDFIEAPLSGSSQQIAAGQATAAAGRRRRRAGCATPTLLQALCPQRLHVGGAGLGARAKLATNLVLGLNRAALAEGLVFAEGLGIAPATFLALVLATPARSDAALAQGRAHGAR
jgi:3-hydroxyisobutyrate dehydrogenase-like beta-hydroxyacid dehydrogenase